MTDEQKPELAAEVAPATPEAAPVASEVQPEVKKEYVSNEPRHPLQDILDKAAEKAKAKEAATSKEVKPEALPDNKGVPAFDYSKWDGNVLTLPENIKKLIDDNKTAFHTKAQEAADFKAKFEELQNKVNSYLQEKQTEEKPLFTEEEFQAAQLDPNKFLELTSKVAKDIVEKEKAQLTPMISQIQYNQQVAENEKKINDFASKNPDFWNLYEAKILEPFVAKFGLEEGYKMAASIANNLKQDAVLKAQARVQEKKASISATPTSSQTVEVLYVNNPNEVLPTQIRMAAEGKKVKVRYKPN